MADTDSWQGADAILDAISDRASKDELTTWLESDLGRMIAWVSNRDRVMLVLMNHEGDAGEHAIDPDAPGSSSGFILENGQADEYADTDTVVASHARQILRALLTTGHVPAEVPWAVDRG